MIYDAGNLDQFMQEKKRKEKRTFLKTIYEHLLWTFCQTTRQTALSGQSQAQVFDWPLTLTLWLTKICLELHKQNAFSHLWLLLWRCWLWAPRSCTLSVVQRSSGDTQRDGKAGYFYLIAAFIQTVEPRALIQNVQYVALLYHKEFTVCWFNVFTRLWGSDFRF